MALTGVAEGTSSTTRGSTSLTSIPTSTVKGDRSASFPSALTEPPPSKSNRVLKARSGSSPSASITADTGTRSGIVGGGVTGTSEATASAVACGILTVPARCVPRSLASASTSRSPTWPSNPASIRVPPAAASPWSLNTALPASSLGSGARTSRRLGSTSMETPSGPTSKRPTHDPSSPSTPAGWTMPPCAHTCPISMRSSVILGLRPPGGGGGPGRRGRNTSAIVGAPSAPRSSATSA